jgi:hypothetical protein
MSFPFKISSTDPEVFEVAVDSGHCDCTRYLELRRSYGDKTATIRSTKAAPFHTAGIAYLTHYRYEGTAWKTYDPRPVASKYSGARLRWHGAPRRELSEGVKPWAETRRGRSRFSAVPISVPLVQVTEVRPGRSMSSPATCGACRAAIRQRGSPRVAAGPPIRTPTYPGDVNIPRFCRSGSLVGQSRYRGDGGAGAVPRAPSQRR